MHEVISSLTVFFEDPFWVGICECTQDGQLSVCRIVFGGQPKDSEVYAYFLTNWNKLRFSLPIEDEKRTPCKRNPKRLQRAIRDGLKMNGTGTKAQQALNLQREEGKLARKETHRQKSEAEKQRLFALHKQKQKAKHKGR